MKQFRIYFLMISLGLCFACQKVIDPGELPQQDARIVLNSVLYADSMITANISSSKSILSGKDYKFIDNAVCDLYEDGVFLQTLGSSSNGDYYCPRLAKTNKRYTLKVSATGYKSVDATTTLPGNVAITAVERYDSTNSSYYINTYDNGMGMVSSLSGVTKFRFRILDDPNVKNYYSIQPILKLYDSLGTELPAEASVSIMNNTSSQGGFFGDNGNDQGITIDIDDNQLVNGNQVQADVSINAYLNTSASNIKKVTISLAIYNLNSDFYRYKSTLNAQASQGASLFAEPVMVYSNVSNGMGILAGANTNTVFIYSGAPIKQ